MGYRGSSPAWRDLQAEFQQQPVCDAFLPPGRILQGYEANERLKHQHREQPHSTMSLTPMRLDFNPRIIVTGPVRQIGRVARGQG